MTKLGGLLFVPLCILVVHGFLVIIGACHEVFAQRLLWQLLSTKSLQHSLFAKVITKRLHAWVFFVIQV